MTDTLLANTATIAPTRTTKLLGDNGTADGAITPAALFGLLQAGDMPIATAATIGGIKADGTTIAVAADGTASVVGSASIPALPSAMVTTDTFDVQRAGNTYTATVAQAIAILSGTQLVIGTTATTAAAGNDARIVGAAQSASLALVATSGSYADLAGKPTIPVAPGVATATVAGIVKAGSGLAVAGDGTLSTTGTPTTPVTSTYTASGAIAVTDKLALVNSASAVSMTLAAGATDGQAMIVKRYGVGAVTLALTLDGTASTAMTLNSAAVPRESLSLIWSTPLATWLLV